LGIVVADVTDKGIGAALFMALSSTLLRTYSNRYPSLPALTMDAVNERILSDTRGGMFVSAFYGVLEPHTGRIRYANAGHPSACLVSSQKGKKPVDRLAPTGMALGIMSQAQWQQKIARLNPGDVLLLYTDGITEAQNPQGTFFGEGRLMEVLRSKSSCSAGTILDAVLAEVHRFVDTTPRQDDIAVIVIKREES
jgi:serine phosphatase RsbU (regulator of sigma subunit)